MAIKLLRCSMCEQYSQAGCCGSPATASATPAGRCLSCLIGPPASIIRGPCSAAHPSERLRWAAAFVTGRKVWRGSGPPVRSAMTKPIQKITLSASRDIPFNQLVLSQSNPARQGRGLDRGTRGRHRPAHVAREPHRGARCSTSTGPRPACSRSRQAGAATARSSCWSGRSGSAAPRRCPASCAPRGSPRRTASRRTSSARPCIRSTSSAPSRRCAPRGSARRRSPRRSSSRRPSSGSG